MDDVVIVGAGIGGLTLGLALHKCGIPCRIFESAAEIRPIAKCRNMHTFPYRSNTDAERSDQYVIVAVIVSE